jgi:mono/diheme cytochrome c family protein
MTHLSKALLGTAALMALALPPSVAAQGGAADPAAVAAGMALWKKHGCQACHGFGRRLAGPDLAGLQERRSLEWIRRWMKDTKSMLETDSISKQLLKESNGARMPQFRVSDADIDNLLAFIASETAKRRAM